MPKRSSFKNGDRVSDLISVVLVLYGKRADLQAYIEHPSVPIIGLLPGSGCFKFPIACE